VGTIRVDPDHLDAYVASSQRLNDVLRERTEQLVATYSSVASEWQWGTVDATSALSALATFVALNDTDDAWVALIAAAFRELDAHFPDGVPVEVIEGLLAEHGLDGGREEVTFDDPSAVGLPLSSGWANDPVATATGHLAEVEVDLPLPDDLGPLRLARVHSSRHRRPGVFGRGWTSWLDVGLELADDGATLLLPDGRRVRYVEVAGRLSPTVACRAAVERTEDGFAVRFPNGDRWQLDADGRLGAVRTATGTTTFERGDDGVVVALRHDAGRVVEVDHLGGRVSAVRSSDGRRIAYSYDEAGDLLEVDGPAGTRRFELGEDGLILAAHDADGVLLFRNTYDDEGRVTSQRSAHGRTTRFSYLRPGVTIVDDADGGPRTTFIHDEAGRLVGVIDDDGAHQSTRYDAAGDPIASMDRDGTVTTRVFDDAGRPVRVEGPDGAVTELAYDHVGRPVRRTGPDGGVVELGYEGDARDPVRLIDPLGAVTTCELDDRGRTVAVTDPDGVTTRFERDADGQVVAVVAGDGARSTVTLDPAGRVVATTAADGATTTFTRDAAGHVTSRTTPDGAVTRWERSPAGRVTRVISPRGSVSELRYGDHGELDEVVDPTGVTVGYAWDRLGHLVAVTDAAGGRTTHAYDGLSRLVATTDPTGRTWRREHDAVGRTLATEGPDGSRRTRTYDAAGRVVGLTDEAGATAAFTYDGAGRIATVTDALGGVTRFAHDAAGQRTRVEDPSGAVTTWSWTPAGRLAAVTTTGPDDADAAQTRRFRYDAAGRLAAVSAEADGEPVTDLALERDDAGEVVALLDGDRRIEVLRDERGRIVGTDDGDGPSWRTEFDHAGRPVTTTSPAGGTSTFAYDAAGRLEDVTDPLGGLTRLTRGTDGVVTGATDPAGGTQRYEHDEAGRLTAVTDALGRRTEVHHDDAGRVSGHTDAAGGTERIERDAAGRIVALTDRTGRRVDVTLDPAGRPVAIADPERRVELSYDHTGRLTRRVRDGRVHTYDRSGRRFVVTDPDGVRTVYERDAAGRIVAIDHDRAGRATLTRDRAGRPLRLVAPDLERRWTWDARGQLTALDQTTPEGTTSTRLDRDDAGRVTAVTDATGTTRLQHDAAGQLTGLTLPDGRTWRFGYDHGRRVHEVAPDGSERHLRYDPAGQLVAIEGPDGTTRLVNDRLGRRVRREDPDGTTVTYGWGAGGRLTSLEHRDPDGAERSLALTIDPTGDLIAVDGIALDWDHATGLPVVDRAGDTHLVADGAATVAGDGTASWAATDPFGGPAGLGLPASLGIHRGEVPLAAGVGRGARGEVTVDGLVWLRARAYDPDTGTFLSPDPLPPVLGGAHVANPYHLAANDPVHLVDPWGLQPLTDVDLAAYNDQAGRGLHTRIGDGFRSFVDDPWAFVQDNWQGIVAGGLIVLGTVMIATGVGAPIGVGMLVGAGASLTAQVALTGEVDGTTLLVDTALGAGGGALGGALNGTRLSTQVAVGAGFDAASSTGSQLVLTGRVDPANLAIEVAFGSAVTSGSHAWRTARSVDVDVPTAAVSETVAAPRVLPPGADPTSEIAVVGRQWDTAVARDWPGHEVLDVPNWSIRANDAWVDSVIDRQLPVYVASPETKSNLFDVLNDRPTVFGRELDQLRQAGYVPVDDVGHVLVPGGGP
jgi:RHS repeat-associated protein